jgi:hypothetical protein
MRNLKERRTMMVILYEIKTDTNTSSKKSSHKKMTNYGKGFAAGKKIKDETCSNTIGERSAANTVSQTTAQEKNENKF